MLNDPRAQICSYIGHPDSLAPKPDSAGSTVIVKAHVPLKEMFGYISDLRSMTKGRASFTMQFNHYEPVPRNIADEIMAKSA